MQLKRCTWIVLLVVVLHVTSTALAQFRSDDYFYFDPDMEYEDEWTPNLADAFDSDEQPNNFPFSAFPRSALFELGDAAAETTTECETEEPGGAGKSTTSSPTAASGAKAGADKSDEHEAAGNKTNAQTNSTSTEADGGEHVIATTCFPLPYPYQHGAATTAAPETQHESTVPQTHMESTTAASEQSSSTASAESTTASANISTTAAPLSANSTENGTSTTSLSTTVSSLETTTCITLEAGVTKPSAEGGSNQSTTTTTSTTTTAPTTPALPAPPPPSVGMSTPAASQQQYEATTCIPLQAAKGAAPASFDSSYTGYVDQEGKAKELHQLVQHLYVAQARVQLEAIEIKKAQAVANSAQQQLEEAANHVRSVTAALQTAQQEVASAAIRAQTAQLQLAAHDQLLFAARQDVDALSSQMVGLQAAEGISAPTLKFDVNGLLDKLKQPLAEGERPTPVPPVVVSAVQTAPKRDSRVDDYYDYD